MQHSGGESRLTRWVIGAILGGGLSLLGYLSSAEFERLNDLDVKAAEKNAAQDVQLAVVNTKLDQILETLTRIERTQRHAKDTALVDKSEKAR